MEVTLKSMESRKELHTRRKPRRRTKRGVPTFQIGIRIGKVTFPETFNDVPSRSNDGIRIRIVFTKHFKNKVLIGGMTARI
jgi:hypothetical protein